MPSEPAWSKQISNSTVCAWFYALAILNLFIGVAGVLGGLYAMSKGKGSMNGVVVSVLFTTIAFTNSWAFFLMCNRGINK